MPDASAALDKFGQFIMERLRDRSIDNFDLLARGRWKSPPLRRLHEELSRLSDDERDLVRRVVVEIVDNGVHDFLFALKEAHDFETGIEVVVDGTRVAEVSDGLQGEPYGENGWQSKFSRHPGTRGSGA